MKANSHGIILGYYQGTFPENDGKKNSSRTIHVLAKTRKVDLLRAELRGALPGPQLYGHGSYYGTNTKDIASGNDV